MPNKGFEQLSGIKSFKVLDNAFVAILCCPKCNYTVILETYSPYKALCTECANELKPLRNRINPRLKSNKGKKPIK